MTEPKPLSLHVPEPPVRPGGNPDFSQMAIPEAGTVRRPPVDVAAREIHDLAYSIIRVLNRQGEAVGPWAEELDPDDAQERPQGHDEDPRLRRPHDDGATPGQGLLLHAVHRRGGRRLRLPDGAWEGRHELPDLSPARAADRAGLAAGGPDMPGLLQRGGPPAGPAAPGAVLGAGGRLLLRIRAISARNTCRPWAGRWPPPSAATRASPRPGSATARPPRATSTRRWSSPPSTARR